MTGRIKQRDVVGWGLMSKPPVEYVYGQKPDDGKRTPEDMSSGEIQAFLMEHPDVTTKSGVIRRCLAFLDTFRPAGRRP